MFARNAHHVKSPHLLVWIVAAAFAFACAPSPSSSIGATKPESIDAPSSSAFAIPKECNGNDLPQSGLRRGTFTITTSTGDHTFQVELAESGRQKQIGMMCRAFMRRDHGMVFLFERPSKQSFWMKNTLIALDMVFLDHEWRVVGVVENATPLTLVGRSVPGHSQFVLEILGGVAKEIGIEAGQLAVLIPESVDASSQK